MVEEPSKNDYRPKFYELLSPADQEQYNEIRSTLSSQMCRNRRGKRLEGFSDILASIRSFCIRHNDDDWKRCLVCGVCWLANGIAINNRQLSLLIDKCKSSINGSFQKMGYSTLQSRNESSGSLCDCIPLLKNNFNELREWTVRLFVAATPQPMLPIYSVNTLYPFQSPAPSQYRSHWSQPRVMSAPPPPPEPELPPPSTSAPSFFDDAFAVPPAFLADELPSVISIDAPAPEEPQPGPENKQDIDLVACTFDPFSVFPEKW
jgi:hypothetical protein